jgi:hypothetical protein
MRSPDLTDIVVAAAGAFLLQAAWTYYSDTLFGLGTGLLAVPTLRGIAWFIQNPRGDRAVRQHLPAGCLLVAVASGLD